MKKIREINNFIRENLSSTVFIIIVLAFIVSALFSQNIGLVITLLIFICTEQIIIIYGYLEKILSHTKKVKILFKRE